MPRKLHRTRYMFYAVVFLVVSTVGLTTMPVPAQADEGRPTSVRVTMEMVRIGVDHQVAEANGYEVRVDRNGIEYAVPKGSPPGLDNTVPGPCGSSFVEWDNVDWFRHKAWILTGFDILPGWPEAVSVPTWQSAVTDNYGVSTREHGPTFDVLLPPSRHWVGKYLPFVAGGPTGAWVDITFGMAVLANGTICFSLNPWDYIDL